MDGNYLTKEQLGKDVKLRDGVSFVDIEWWFMYNLIKPKNLKFMKSKLFHALITLSLHLCLSG